MGAPEGLRRLVAIELKLGSFDVAYKGQMELYLRWLDKYERRPGEEPLIRLMLCGEKDREQIELLQLDRGEIRVAEYLVELPQGRCWRLSCMSPCGWR
jgi:YhcG PDDEXK nuclease domain